MKKIWKSVNIWRSYGQYCSAWFFLTHSVHAQTCRYKYIHIIHTQHAHWQPVRLISLSMYTRSQHWSGSLWNQEWHTTPALIHKSHSNSVSPYTDHVCNKLHTLLSVLPCVVSVKSLYLVLNAMTRASLNNWPHMWVFCAMTQSGFFIGLWYLFSFVPSITCPACRVDSINFNSVLNFNRVVSSTFVFLAHVFLSYCTHNITQIMTWEIFVRYPILGKIKIFIPLQLCHVILSS